MKTITKKVFFFAIAGAVFAGPLFAAPKPKAKKEEPAKAVKDDEVIPPEVSDADKNAATTEVKDSYYVKSPSYATEPIDSTKPDYAKKLSETGIGVFKNIDWITFGIEQRTRYEFHANDFRQTNFATTGASAGNPTSQVPGGTAGASAPPDAGFTLFKTRAFLKLEFDWFRLVGELQDSRRTETYYADTDGRDFNTVEPIQAYAEFHFKNLFGYDRPLTVRAGRFSLELLDRRLVGLNEWRNTTNTFQGGRVTIGQKSNDWYLDLIGAQPIQRYLYDFDQPVGKIWFYGGVLSIQKWSHITTLQPFYLGLQQDGLTAADNSTNPVTATRSYRNIHTVGLRAYGKVGKSGFDYDASYIKQLGTHALTTATAANGGGAIETKLDAFAAWGELGYTLDVAWKPRLAGFYAFISGDNPDTATNKDGGTNEGFDRLYGFGRPWSSNDYFRAENLNSPKIILEFEPFKDLKIDTAYAWYWTASPHAGISGILTTSGQQAQAVTSNASLVPASANAALGNVASDKIGEEYNIRVRYPFPHLRVDVGYAYFKAGEWLTYVKRGGESHFAYAQVSARLWD